MRHAYYDGAPGVLVSGLVWLAATFVSTMLGVYQGVWTLLIGGALIHPVSGVLTRALGRPAKAGKGNPLEQLGMASTFWLILCCAMAYGLFLYMPVLFFPAMMATIGCRYLVFASLFGRKLFWVMGATLIGAGIAAFFLAAPPVLAAAMGGAIEVLFASFMLMKSRSSAPSAA